MNLLTADTVTEATTEFTGEIVQNGGGIPLAAIVVTVIALLVVLFLLMIAIVNKSKTEVKPVSQKDIKKRNDKKQAAKEKERKAKEEKPFLEKPSGLPEDNKIGAKRKNCKKPVAVEKPKNSKVKKQPKQKPVKHTECKVENPVNDVKESEETVLQKDIEITPIDYNEKLPVFENANGTELKYSEICVNGNPVKSAVNCLCGDHVVIRFNYSIETSFNPVIKTEIINNYERFSNVAASYDGNTITLSFDCKASTTINEILAKTFINPEGILKGKMIIEFTSFIS